MSNWSTWCRSMAMIVSVLLVLNLTPIESGCAIEPVDGHVEIPSSWTFIGNFSFISCTSIITLAIPNTITVIGYRSFANCSSLKYLDVPDSVVKIDYQAFDGCTSLTTANIGTRVRTLGEAVFYACHSLKVINLPDSLVEIPESTFFNCWKLDSVVIPDGVMKIGYAAFANCTSLSDVTIGRKVIEIGDAAFASCGDLQSVSLSESVVIIGRDAFISCNLRSITFSANVRHVGDFAFAFNFDLAQILINSPRITFNDSVFSHCDSLDASSQVYITRHAESITNLRGDLVDFQCLNGKCGCQAGHGNGITDSEYVDSYFTCVQCKAGKTNAPLSQKDCQDCAAGSYAPLDGSPACIPCTPGKYSEEVGAITSSLCKDCARGKYTAASGSSSCQSAPPGNFCNETGLARYFSCEAGYHTDKYGQTSCAHCTTGRYQNETGAPTCKLCAIGKYNPTDGATSESFCYDCPAGEYSGTAGLPTCQLCGQNTYSDDSMPIKDSCKKCPAGMMTPNEGATKCIPVTSPCQAGSMRNMSSGVCHVCEPGQYSPDGVKCLPCPYSSYNAKYGSPICSLCPAGRFGVGDSNVAMNRSSLESSCDLCPKGKFVTSDGASECQNCPPGSYCEEEGMDIGNLCPVGTYTDEKCQVACRNCPAGRYQSSIGSAKCSACPKGKHNSVERATNKSACLDCSRGRYAREVGLANCTTCSTGQFATLIGQTECQVCADVYGAMYTNDVDKTGCIEIDSLAASDLDVLFNGGGALYGTFSVAIIFVLVTVLVQYKRVKYNGRIAKIGHGRALGRAMITGFIVGSELFLIAGIWPQATYLSVIMLLSRILHVGGGVLLFVCAFSRRDDIVEFIQRNIPQFSVLRDFINMNFARKNMALLCVTFVAMAFDNSMLTFLPWKESRFYRESHGMPSLEVLKFYLALTTLHSFVSVCCEISYLSFYSYPDGTNGDVANALFALNITFSAGGMVVGFVQYFIKSELLGALQQDIDRYFESKRKREDGTEMDFEESIQIQDLYDAGNSELAMGYLSDNPLRVETPAASSSSKSSQHTKGISSPHTSHSTAKRLSGKLGAQQVSMVIDSKASSASKGQLPASKGKEISISPRRTSLAFSKSSIETRKDLEKDLSSGEEDVDAKRMSFILPTDEIP